MSIYLASDSEGSLLVDAVVSHLTGEPISPAPFPSPAWKPKLLIDVTADGKEVALGKHDRLVGLDTRDNELSISLDQFPPRLAPYKITVKAALAGEHKNFQATTELYRLPQRTDGGSATRLDHLYGGLAVVKGNQTEWTPIFPYTYYGEFDGPGTVSMSIENRLTENAQSNGSCTSMPTYRRWMSSPLEASMSYISWRLAT